LVDLVERNMAAIGAWIERTPGRDGFGDILKTRTPWGGDGPGILVVSTLDTVHPMGTLAATLPFTRAGDVAYGHGITDMTCGAYHDSHAPRHHRREGHNP